jgi:hypothetical protein
VPRSSRPSSGSSASQTPHTPARCLIGCADASRFDRSRKSIVKRTPTTLAVRGDRAHAGQLGRSRHGRGGELEGVTLGKLNVEAHGVSARAVEGALRQRGRVDRALPEIDQAAVCGWPAGSCGSAAGAPARTSVRGSASKLETGADVHHWRAPRVDRADDLLDVDALQVDARRGHVRMSQLPLDDRERHSLARELNGVRVTELVLVPTSAQAPICRPDR